MSGRSSSSSIGRRTGKGRMTHTQAHYVRWSTFGLTNKCIEAECNAPRWDHFPRPFRSTTTTTTTQNSHGINEWWILYTAPLQRVCLSCRNHRILASYRTVNERRCANCTPSSASCFVLLKLLLYFFFCHLRSRSTCICENLRDVDDKRRPGHTATREKMSERQ